MKDSDTQDDISYSIEGGLGVVNDTLHCTTQSYHPPRPTEAGNVHFNFDTFCISGAQKSDFSTQDSKCELITMFGFRLIGVDDSERSRNIDQVHPGWI